MSIVTSIVRSARHWVLPVALGTAWACGDGSNATSHAPAKSDSSTGRVGLQLMLPDGLTIATVDYAISGPTSEQGSVPVGSSASIQFLVGGLTAGSYTIDLTATDTSGDPCAGSGAFTIAPGAVTGLSLAMVCMVGGDAVAPAPVNTGSLSVEAGVIEEAGAPTVCPGISSLSATPQDLFVGSTSALSVTTLGGAPTIQWTQSDAPGQTGAGTFANASAASTTFTCTQAGQVLVTVSVATGGCIGEPFTTMFAVITCEPPMLPNGGPQSVLQRGNDVYRRATFTEPGLTTAAVTTMAPDTTFNANATFPANGNSQNQGTASVLYLQEGPSQAGCPVGAMGCTATGRAPGAGLFFAFPALGANPNVVAFDETSGLPVWTSHVTSGADGIRGTPVVDPVSRRLFVVTGNNPHLVHALSVDTGGETTTGGWPVTLSSATLSYNGATFNSAAENQHGASLLVNHILYIPFGGPFGDGGSYLGWIVALDITNPTRLAGWATQSPRSGIWGSGGLASDGTFVFGVTGDTTSQPRATSDSQEVVRVTGMAQFTRNEASVFYPTEWQGWDRPTADLDFGASTPAFIPLPAGSNPPSLLVAPAKAGRLFVLNGADLSSGTYPNAGGALADLVVASTTAESVYTAPTVYTSASGLHTAINVGAAPAGCPAGTPATSEMVISMRLTPGQTPIATEAWCAPNSGGGHLNYPPISTTTDGVAANAMVWFVNGTQLTAVDGDTGSAIVTTSGAPCANVPSMSFPIAVNNRIVVAALGHLCSWSLNGM